MRRTLLPCSCSVLLFKIENEGLTAGSVLRPHPKCACIESLCPETYLDYTTITFGFSRLEDNPGQPFDSRALTPIGKIGQNIKPKCPPEIHTDVYILIHIYMHICMYTYIHECIHA